MPSKGLIFHVVKDLFVMNIQSCLFLFVVQPSGSVSPVSTRKWTVAKYLMYSMECTSLVCPKAMRCYPLHRIVHVQSVKLRNAGTFQMLHSVVTFENVPSSCDIVLL